MRLGTARLQVIPGTDERLRAWAQEVTGGAEITLGPPADDASGEGVSLYLLDLMNVPPARTGSRPPRQAVLRYLVSAWSEEPTSAHRLLEELFFSAVETPDVEVESEPLDPHLWAALGVAPQPGFVIRVPVRRERAREAIPLVREILAIDVVPITYLRGTVLGPRDLPLPGVRVELPSLNLATRTDPRGFFQFSSVPAREGTRTLRLEGKGRAMVVTAEVGEEPIVIHFPLPEE